MLISSSPYVGLFASLTAILILHFLSNPARAFKCFVCDSKNDIDCTENLAKDSRLKPQECQNVIGAKYCVKTTNIYAGELGTKRFCAANDHGNYCRYVRQPTGDREYRSCVLTCDSENCNGSSELLNKRNMLFTAVPLVLMVSYFLMT